MAQNDKTVKHEIGLLPNVHARGKALRRTDKQLDSMTSPEALEALVEEAQADWQENAPTQYKTLLDSRTK